MEEIDNSWKNLKRTLISDTVLNEPQEKRKLIIRVFYINVGGLSRQQAKQQIYELMNEYKHDENDLPEDIFNQYYFDDVWLPIHGESRLEIIVPDNFIELEKIKKQLKNE
jgi:hypothetical protein